MIQIYLNAFGPGSSKKDVDELERLAGQLSLSETDDQVQGILSASTAKLVPKYYISWACL